MSNKATVIECGNILFKIQHRAGTSMLAAGWDLYYDFVNEQTPEGEEDWTWVSSWPTELEAIEDIDHWMPQLSGLST
jgi:hypothetical protein